MKQLLLLLMVAFATNLHAKNYYVSATGNDASDGLTTATPWKSIAKVNSFTFAANDYILFKRGDTFYGGIIINRANLNFDAYGTGSKPVISGLSAVTGWVNLGGNIWEAPVTNVKAGVNLVLRNNVIQQVGRYPNADAPNGGYLTYTTANSISITGPAISSTINWTGAEVAIRVNRWDIMRRTVTAHSAGVVSFSSLGQTPRPKYGYFFQRDSRTLDVDGEWWYDEKNSKLKVYSTSAPSAYNYQISTIDILFKNVYGSIKVTNLSFIGADVKAISNHGGSGITIINCDVNKSGKEAITVNSAINVLIDGCTINNSLGSGIRVSNPTPGIKTLTITNCDVDSTALIAGMEASDGVNGSAAILCRGGDDIKVLNNRVTNCGYIGIEWQGNDAYIKNNFVDNFCSVRDDGGGIYTVETGVNYLIPERRNRNVIGNIVINGIGANKGSDDLKGKNARGLYVDLGTRNVLFDSNTSAYNAGSAFHGNNNKDITFINNVFFGNHSTHSLQRFDSAALVRGMIIKKNILYPYRFVYRNLGINYSTAITKEADLLAMGVLDSNYYSLSGPDTSLHAVTTNVDRSNYKETVNNFAFLTSTVGIETHSTNVANTGTLEYNASSAPKTVSFMGLSKVEPNGTVHTNAVVILPWSSKVLIPNGPSTSSNKLPLSNAGSNQIISLPINTANLNGSGTDEDGTISSYAWLKISGPTIGNITTPNTAITAVNNLVQGIYLFELTVTDNKGATGKDTMQLTVNAAANIAPLANAGTDKTITLPVNYTTLKGTGVDEDGTINSYKWLKISGPTSGTITTPNTSTSEVTNLAQGIYQYELTVTDNIGAIGKDTIQVTVNAASNQAPAANAGTDKIIILPVNSTSLVGTGTDEDGTISNFSWVKISGPASGTIGSPGASTTAVTNLEKGIYQFGLTVTDNNGSIGKDTVQVTVRITSNQSPTANAGTDKTITLPINTISLNGTGTDADGTISNFEWVKISGPASGTIASPNTANTLVNNLSEGIYQYELTVTDNNGAYGTDTIKVTVNAATNQAPEANAGNKKSIKLPTNATTLSGSGTDLDGKIISYTWTKVSGPLLGSIATGNQAITEVTNLVQGIYQFELAVTDNNGAIGRDTAQVTVSAASNQAPVAKVGSSKKITETSNSITLSGSGEDADGTISSYEWAKVSGPLPGTIVTAGEAITLVNNLVSGIYEFELTVTDDNGATGKDTLQVTVSISINQVPVANAGIDKAITLPGNTTSLNGIGTDSDGTISSYAWLKISGPEPGNIASANKANTEINQLIQGIYQFELTVTDDKGAIGKDTIQVTVIAATNLAPQANAGTDKTITLPINTINLNGAGTDTDGTISSYAWIKISGPEPGIIATANNANTAINNLVQGLYQFELTVTDNKGATGKDTIKVYVNAATNEQPLANAGADKTITLPVNSTSLTGSGTDTDGTISSYTWIKISGPEPGTIATANTANTVINNLVEGLYQFELTVTDNNGATGKDTVKVFVNAATNEQPLANAGADKTITLPVNSINLTGSGTDTDGSITNYTWVKLAGPAQGTIASVNTAATAINNLIEGIYQFELTVTDNKGAIGRDTVQVTVNAVSNLAPSANAGTDIIITLPKNTINLNGGGTDLDGSISSYTWIKIAGPAAGEIESKQASTTIVNNLIQGVYQFELAVTDNNGATGKDTVQVTVNAAAIINKVPVANAGDDINIVLPTNSVSLKGTAIDPDGTIVTYKWEVISGPSGHLIATPNQSETKIENLFQGVYVIQFTALDNSGAETRDSISVTVSSPRLSNTNSNSSSTNQFKVYPNPVKDIANINITTINKNTKLAITIMNASGNLVAGKEFVTADNSTIYQIDMSNLTNGLYIITLRFDDGQVLSTKILKNGAN